MQPVKCQADEDLTLSSVLRKINDFAPQISRLAAADEKV
jgi:hypothetical protein